MNCLGTSEEECFQLQWLSMAQSDEPNTYPEIENIQGMNLIQTMSDFRVM